MPNDNINNREIRVFISSTFNDMNAERDYLLRHIFPEVIQACNERQVGFTEIDLRWGITEEEAKNGETVAICLQEIDRCRDYPPFFIGMLGERYGWIPNENDLNDYLNKKVDDTYTKKIKEGLENNISVTELEFQYGALEGESEALFYIRDEALTETLLKENNTDKSEYYDEERKKINTFKSNVRNDRRLQIDGYKSIEEFGEHIKNKFLEYLDIFFPIIVVERHQEITSPHTYYASYLRKSYVPILPMINYVFEHIDNKLIETENRHLVIKGDTGSGKSSFLADLSLRLSALKDKFLVLEFYAGIENLLTIEAWVDKVIYLIELDLNNSGHKKDKINIRMEEEERKWPELHRCINKWKENNPSKKLILILDSLDVFENKKYIDIKLRSINRHENFKLITTSSNDFITHGNAWAVKIHPLLDNEQKLQIIVNYFTNYRKKLPKDISNNFENSKFTTNPLYLKIILNQIRVRSSYESLHHDSDLYLNINEKEEIFLRLITDLNKDQKNNGLVLKALSYIAISRRGITENMLYLLMDNESDKRILSRVMFSKIISIISPLTKICNGRISLSHPTMNKTILENTNEKKTREQLVIFLKIIDTYSNYFLKLEILYHTSKLSLDGINVSTNNNYIADILSNARLLLDIIYEDRETVELAINALKSNKNTYSRHEKYIISSWNEGSYFEQIVREPSWKIDTSIEFLSDTGLSKLKTTWLDVTLENWNNANKNRTDKSYINYLILSGMSHTINKSTLSGGRFSEALNILNNTIPLDLDSIAFCKGSIALEKIVSSKDNVPEKIKNDLETILKTLETSTDKNIETLIFIINCLSKYHIKTKNFNKAEETLLNAIELFENPLDDSLSSVYNNLSFICKDDLDKKEMYIKKSIDIKQNIYPEGNPSIYIGYQNLGNIYLERGEYKKSLDLHRSAYNGLIHTLPSGDSKIESTTNSYSLSLNNLTHDLIKDGDIINSIPLLKEFIILEEKRRPKDDTDLAIKCRGLGNLLLETKQFEESKKSYLKSLHILNLNPSKDYENIIITIKKLENYCKIIGDYKLAKKYFREGVSISKNKK